MDQFIVSARKYRPVTFDLVVGQAHVTNTLKNAIKSDHLAQAFLFCGPRGVGKTTCARILAKTVNCLNLSVDMNPCNTCESCEAFNRQANFSIFELDAASNNSVDDIRALVEQVRYPPQGARYKVYIIDEVHMLSTAAFNAFLKTLEEPPSYAIFILATTERHKILPTILSRCQVFDFFRIRQPDIVGQLKQVAEKEGIEYEEEGLRIIAEKADGAMRDALTIFDQMVSYGGNKITYKLVIENLNILDYEYFFSACKYLAEAEIPHILLLLDEIIKRGFDGLTFLTGLSGHMRNLLIAGDPATVNILDFGKELKERYEAQAGKLNPTFILNALNIAANAEMSIKSARNGRLHLELTLIKMAYLTQVLTTDEKKKPNEQLINKKNDKENTENFANQASNPPAYREKSALHVEDSLQIAEYNQESEVTAFNKAWISLREELEASKQFKLLAYLPENCPLPADGQVLTIPVNSSLALEELGRIKPMLENILKGKTGLTEFRIELEKTDMYMPVLQPYTDREKFDELVKVNPLVKDLQNLLKLDFN